MGNGILEHPQRTDDRAINAAERQGEQHQKDDDPHIQGQEGGQELDFGHPAKIGVQGAGKVQQQQGDPYPEQDGKPDSQFF